MQVSAEAASCTAHVPDLLPSGDLLAHLYISTAHMCVQGGRAISCADDDVVAGPGTDIPADYGAGGRGVDGGSATGGKVLTSVVPGPASSGSEGCTDPVASFCQGCCCPAGGCGAAGGSRVAAGGGASG